MYDPNSLQQTVPGNAMVGAYLGALGLNYDPITWIVEPKPQEMHWLTPELAAKFNIDYQLIRRDEATSRGYRGWTNVLYMRGNNGQLACHIEPNATGCRW